MFSSSCKLDSDGCVGSTGGGRAGGFKSNAGMAGAASEGISCWWRLVTIGGVDGNACCQLLRGGDIMADGGAFDSSGGGGGTVPLGSQLQHFLFGLQ